MNALVPYRQANGRSIVCTQRTPFHSPIYRAAVLEGASIAEIVASIPIEHMPPAFAEYGRVTIDGFEIKRELWRVVRPKPGHVIIVDMQPRQGGGGGGGKKGKNIFAMIAMIALIAVATLVSAGALGGVLGSAFAAGAIGAKVLAIGITVAGQLLISALTKPPSPKAARSDTTDFGNASATGNVLAPGASIPRVAGTHRIFPPLAAQGFVETVGDDQFAEVTLVLAGPHKLESIQINSVSIESMPEVTVDTREGWPDDDLVSLISRTTGTTQPNVTMSQLVMDKDTTYKLKHQATPDLDFPTWHRVRTYQDPDEIRIQLVWGQGLYDADTPTTALSVPVRFRIRHEGSASWYNLPEIHFTNSKANLYRKDVIFRWGAAPVPLNTPPTAEAPYQAFANVPPQSVGPPVYDDGWMADVHFFGATSAYNSTSNVELNEDNVNFYLDKSSFSNKGVIEIEMIRGSIYQNSLFTPATYVHNYGINNVHDFFRTLLHAGLYKSLYDYGGVSDRVQINSVSSLWYELPVTPGSGLAVIQIRARNRDLQNISVLASGYVPDWDGAEWSGFTITSNPAPHYRYVMGSAQNARPVPTALIDEDSIVDWRDYCNKFGYTCDALIEGNTVADVLDTLASCGRARPRMADRWGVIIDRYRAAEPVVQVFSPINSRNLGFSKAFTRLADGFIVSYRNKFNDYSQAEITVLRPGVIEASASNLEAINVIGIVDETLVRDRARFDLRQLTARQMQWSLEVDIEGLKATRGDIVGVQHDMLKSQAGFARIKQVLFNSSDFVAGLILDQGVLVNDPTSIWDVPNIWIVDDIWGQGLLTGALIRGDDGTIYTKQIEGDVGNMALIGFTVPFEMPEFAYADDKGVTRTYDTVTAGCLIVTGPLGSEARRMVITDIKMGRDIDASLSLLDEAPELTITERGVPFVGGVYFVGDVGFR